jgi:hypothetical protein
MTISLLFPGCVLAPAIALVISSQDPVRTDVTPPHPDDFVVTNHSLALYESDGGGCKKFDLRNVDANPSSKQSITIVWQGVTGEPDPVSGCEIWPGQHVIRECFIKRIIVTETNRQLGSSTHRMSRITQ